MAEFFLESGGSKRASWSHFTRCVVPHMTLCPSGQESLWLKKLACKLVICPKDMTASLVPAWDLLTLQNSHLLSVSCCHILEGEGWRGQLREERRGERRVGDYYWWKQRQEEGRRETQGRRSHWWKWKFQKLNWSSNSFLSFLSVCLSDFLMFVPRKPQAVTFVL